MQPEKKNMKEQNKAGFRPITSLLIGLAFLTVVLIVTMLNASRDMAPSTGTQNDLSQGGVSATPEALYDSELLGVVKGIDETNQLVTVFDIKTGQDVILNYTGGSDIQDKYGQIITMSQMPIGSMVDVGYSKDDEKLVKMHISNKAWVYADVNNLNIDQDKHIMQVADTKYKYSDNIQVFNEDKLIPVSDLAEQDVLTLWGYDQTVWSITVVKGHGTVKLADYDAFLDGNVTVGYEAMQQITDDTLITVREGNYNLTVENGDFSATKNVTVTRGKETVVSLADLGPEAVKKGKITFDITPFGADLFVDGELTSYANPIELPYGDHDIKVSLGGYTTFQGTLNVDEAGKSIMIDLPEENSNKDVGVSVIGNGKATGSGSSNTGDTADTSNNADWVTDGTGQTNDSALPTPKPDSGKDTADDKHLIYVQNPIGASIYIDGKFMGISPGSFQKIIGSHVITFIKEGYVTKSYSIDVQDDGLDTYFSLPDLEKSTK